MDKVKKLHEAGASITSAIKEALGMTVSEFALKYEIPQPMVSEAINGTRKPSERTLAALIAELGGTEAEWRELLWEAGRPQSSPAA